MKKQPTVQSNIEIDLVILAKSLTKMSSFTWELLDKNHEYKCWKNLCMGAPFSLNVI